MSGTVANGLVLFFGFVFSFSWVRVLTRVGCVHVYARVHSSLIISQQKKTNRPGQPSYDLLLSGFGEPVTTVASVY